MAEQVGWRGLVERLRVEAPHYAKLIPQLPRLAHQVLHKRAHSDLDIGDLMARLVENQRRTNRLLAFLACVTGAVVAGVAVLHVAGIWHGV
jgi:ubiquinone biosynthesis protein